jgi:fructose-bisphosphate aldolase class II
MLTSTAEILDAARAAGTGVGAFNVIQLESAEAIAAGAAEAGLPVIMQISQNCVAYHGALEPVLLATLAVARRAHSAVAVHLDHAVSEDLLREAVDLGVSSVMFDASHLDYADNVARTAAVVQECHTRGVWVEAELGEVGGKDGVHAPGARTEPGEATRFVAATDVDALAVAVGSSHAMTTRDASLDNDLIGRLRQAVPVPLVLHGSSGVSDDGLRAAVAAGMTKINISTHLNHVFTRAVRDRLDAEPGLVDTRRYLGPARDVMAAEVARLLRLLAGPG